MVVVPGVRRVVLTANQQGSDCLLVQRLCKDAASTGEEKVVLV